MMADCRKQVAMDRGKRSLDWTRCSEGFSDIKSFGKESVHDHRKTRKRKSGDVKRCRTTAASQSDADVIGQDIIWSCSESEDETVSEIHFGKRKKVLKHSSPSKRKSLLVSQVPSSSEAVDIDNSDSESETTTHASAQNSGSVMTQEGSIQGYQSGSDGENNCDIKAGQLLHPEKDDDTTDTVSISGSTQSASPPSTSTGLGVKASDWVKSLQLKTPSKSDSQGEITATEDSAKKKKRHSRGGLAEQLSRLQAREKSSVRMWSHQQNKTPLSSQDSSKAVTLKVLGFEVLYSVQVVKCAMLSDNKEMEHKLVMFPVNQSELLNLQIGTEVTVFPPWQQLEMNDGQTIMLCTRFCQVTLQPEDEDRKNCGLSQTGRETVSARWNCPCVQGLCKVPSLCPAFKFPSMPGFIIPKNKPASNDADSVCEDKSRIVSPEKHLYTVAKKTREVEIVSDSLLESIERSSELADTLTARPSSISFKGTVHRVNTICTEKQKRYMLLVEDGHGTVCEIQMHDTVYGKTGLSPDGMERRSFQFKGLTVRCRKPRDKDPSLFSLIDSVWSGSKGMVDSQESENGLSNNEERLSSEPPSFCYILSCEDTESFSMEPYAVSVVQSKPISFMKLIDVQKEINTRRCSCVGKLLYIHSSSAADPNHSRQSVYLIDQSLQKLSQPYIKCSITTSSRFVSLPALQDCRNCFLKLKDAFVDQGHLIADIYTKILIEAAGENGDEIPPLKNIHLPLLDDTAKKMDLCVISGTISGVDEDAAYSWEACNFCNSDQLLSQPTESGDSARFTVCRNCQKVVNSPVLKMKMEVLLKCKYVSNKIIRVDLHQSTIEKLLPTDEAADEGYELSSVLDKPLGPLNCIVADSTETKQQKSLLLKEIELLLP